MPLSTNPVVGFNFLVSVSSVTGTPITLSASNGATQNGTNGLVLSGVNGKRWSATAPDEIKVNTPITLWARVIRSENGSGGESGYGVAGTASQSWRYAQNDRGVNFGWRGRYDNNGTLVTTTSSTLPVNPETVHYFIQFTASAITMWQDTTQVVNSSATRSNPIYTGSDLLYFGSPPWSNTEDPPWDITHAAIFASTLTSQDRTDLVADPLAFMPAGGSSTPAFGRYGVRGPIR
jgi:hypothetical protein